MGQGRGCLKEAIGLGFVNFAKIHLCRAWSGSFGEVLLEQRTMDSAPRD